MLSEKKPDHKNKWYSPIPVIEQYAYTQIYEYMNMLPYI